MSALSEFMSGHSRFGAKDGALLAGFAVRWLRQRFLHARLRRQGVKLAPTVSIVGRCRIDGEVTIGEQTIVQRSYLDGRGRLELGACCILNEATLLTAQHDLDSPQYETTYAAVVVEDYVLMFMGSLVLPGRRLGRGCVVAAGTVVTKDVPSMAVVAGNPARVVRYRKAVHSELELSRTVGLAPKRLQALMNRWAGLGRPVESQ